MRQIDADALLAAMPKTTELLRYEVVEQINRAPTIDAVPLDRLGDFGKLFMDYKGCPRGAMGRMGGVPIEEEVLYMKPITDVDGGRWIPVNADALHELVKKYASLLDSGAQPVIRCLACTRRSDSGLCYKHGHMVADDFFCAHGTTENVKKSKPAKVIEKKTEERCLATGGLCSKCTPGPCDHRRTVILDGSGQ